MRLAVAVVGTMGLASVILVFLILARLTQKWEVVAKVNSHYSLFYVSAALIAIASIVRLLRIGYLGTVDGPQFLRDPQSWFYLCFYYVPLVVGITVSLGITWKSWGWLLGESDDD